MCDIDACMLRKNSMQPKQCVPGVCVDDTHSVFLSLYERCFEKATFWWQVSAVSYWVVLQSFSVRNRNAGIRRSLTLVRVVIGMSIIQRFEGAIIKARNRSGFGSASYRKLLQGLLDLRLQPQKLQEKINEDQSNLVHETSWLKYVVSKEVRSSLLRENAKAL